MTTTPEPLDWRPDGWRNWTRDELQRSLGLEQDGDPGPSTMWAVKLELDELADRRAEDDTQEVILPPAHQFTFGGPDLRRGGHIISRDPGKLLPPFAHRVEQLFGAMRVAGFEPMLWEGYRSPERARALSKRGTGIVDSMHCYGAAVDIVDTDDSHWEPPPGFWRTLRNSAERLGLYVLYARDGRDKDMPHVQAIPVRLQATFRAATPEERLAMVS